MQPRPTLGPCPARLAVCGRERRAQRGSRVGDRFRFRSSGVSWKVAVPQNSCGPDLELTHPIQKLVPRPGERQKPRLAVVQAKRRAGEWNAYKRIVRFVACD